MIDIDFEKGTIFQESVVGLQRRNLGLEAADSIRRMILNGRFPSGAHVVEAALAADLGVSHGTIRAGLQLLQHEGLVEHRPRRGVFVRRLNSKDAWEVYTLRNALEAMAARLAAERITDAGRQELNVVLTRMRKAVKVGDRSDAVASDFQFHRTMVHLSGHRLLEEHYRLLELKIRLFMVLTDAFYPDLTYLLPLHESLLDAVTTGDAGKAETLAADHNVESGKTLVDFLESHPNADALGRHAALTWRSYRKSLKP